jgi:hypothetical protein
MPVDLAAVRRKLAAVRDAAAGAVGAMDELIAECDELGRGVGGAAAVLIFGLRCQDSLGRLAGFAAAVRAAGSEAP